MHFFLHSLVFMIFHFISFLFFITSLAATVVKVFQTKMISVWAKHTKKKKQRPQFITWRVGKELTEEGGIFSENRVVFMCQLQKRWYQAKKLKKLELKLKLIDQNFLCLALRLRFAKLITTSYGIYDTLFPSTCGPTFVAHITNEYVIR